MRFLDWAAAVEASEAKKWRQEDSNIGRARGPEDPPELESAARYPVIIGSDLLYEVRA